MYIYMTKEYFKNRIRYTWIKLSFHHYRGSFIPNNFVWYFFFISFTFFHSFTLPYTYIFDTLRLSYTVNITILFQFWLFSLSIPNFELKKYCIICVRVRLPLSSVRFTCWSKNGGKNQRFYILPNVSCKLFEHRTLPFSFKNSFQMWLNPFYIRHLGRELVPKCFIFGSLEWIYFLSKSVVAIAVNQLKYILLLLWLYGLPLNNQDLRLWALEATLHQRASIKLLAFVVLLIWFRYFVLFYCSLPSIICLLSNSSKRIRFCQFSFDARLNLFLGVLTVTFLNVKYNQN